MSFLQTWWTEPRQTWLRKVLFQVHLWCALLVGLFVSMMGLTGSMIVYKDTIDAKLHPQLMGKSGPQKASPDAMLRLAQSTHPGWNVLLLDAATQPAWAFYISPTGWDAGSKVDVIFIDPATGQIRGHRARGGGFMNHLMDLHIKLLSGDTGNRIVGSLACVVLVVAVTGLIIWWPGRKRWRRNLKIDVHARGPRLNWDLHHAIGFFASVPLALQTFTAAAIVFPALMVPPVVHLLRGDMAEIQRFQDTGQSTIVTGDTRAASLGSMFAESQRRYPGRELNSINFPGSPDDTYQVILSGRHFEERGSVAKVLFDRYSGAVLADVDSDHGSLALRATLAFGPWHYGHFAGVYSHILWMCLGLCPIVLFITGLLMWWRRVLAPWLRRQAH